jgi:excisionase family DNA binding protein
VSTILAGVLTLAQVAARHDVSVSTVRNHITAGHLYAEKFGKQVFVRQEDADRWGREYWAAR